MCLRKGNTVIGLPIICLETEEEIGRIEDLILDRTCRRVRGLLGNTMSCTGSIVISLDRLRGQQVLTSRHVAHQLHIDYMADSALYFNRVCRGSQILDPAAHDLGHVVDIFFRDDGGLIEGYEVSRGLFANLCSGTSFIPSTVSTGVRDGTLRVTSEAAEILESQEGRIEHAVRDLLPTSSPVDSATTSPGES